MKILFRITAHFGYKGKDMLTYYVIAKDSAEAAKLVAAHHKKAGYFDVDYCHSKTVAQSDGTPTMLLA